MEQTHRIATPTEVFSMPPATESDPKEQTMPVVPSAQMPTVASSTDLSAKGALLQDLRPLQENTTERPSTPASSAAEPTQEEPEELITQKSSEQPPKMIPDPALLRVEQVEVNSVRVRLKQTQEMKDFLTQTQTERIKQSQQNERKVMMGLWIGLAILGALFLALQFKDHKAPVAAKPSLAPLAAQEILAEKELPATVAVVETEQPIQPTQTVQTDAQKALSIVQHHLLPNAKGELADYLNRVYRTQLAQGYVSAWETEPLYKNTYIVKYRLTKARKEPIIYVFQADVVANKLTGALNNISLDLVGKI